MKGWFYYGVVKVQGKKADETTTTYYMLDRNLGASNNGYYAPDVVALEKNKKAIGGYFCISKNRTPAMPIRISPASWHQKAIPFQLMPCSKN